MSTPAPTGTHTHDTHHARAHRQAVSMGIDGISAFLQDVFGQRLVAHLADVSDYKRVAQWAKGSAQPRPRGEERLRLAYQVFQLLQAEESPHTVRAWFVGLNPQLDDESPINAIREGRFREVVVAARAFLAGG